jgi:O-antigen ligase
MNLRQNALKYGSFALVFLVPLVFWGHGLYPHISSKTFFIYAFTEILFFFWLYSIIVDKSYRLSKSDLVWFMPLAGFVLWMTISGIFAVDSGLALWSSLGRGTGLLTLYHSLALSLILASLVKRNGFPYIVSLFSSFVASSAILAGSIWLGTEGFNLPIRVLETDAGGGFAGNSTLVAGYLLFTLAMGGFLLTVKNLSKNTKWLILIAMAVTVFSPVFINIYGLFDGRGIIGLARGTILALFTGVGAVGLGYMFLSPKKWIKGTSIGILAIGLITFAFLWMQLVTPGADLHQKFAEGARGSRFIFWDSATLGMSKRPALGYGPENYFMSFQENFNPMVLVEENSFEGWVDRAHNIYYDLGVTGGYPAIILYAVFIMSLLYGAYRLERSGRLSRIQVSIIFGLLVAHIANHLFTFESNLSILTLFAIAGIIYSLGQHEPNPKFLPVSISNSNKNILASILFILFIISATYFVYLPADKSKAYAETFAAGINTRASMYPALLQGSSIGSHFDISGLAFNIYKIYAGSPAEIKNDKEKLPYLIEDLNALVDHLYKVSENNQTDYRLFITIASLENTLTYLSERPHDIDIQNRILNVLEKAQALSPTNPNVYWTMAQTKIWGGDFEGVAEAYRQAIVAAPLLPASYDLALNYAQIVGDQALYNEVMSRAKENIPDYELN